MGTLIFFGEFLGFTPKNTYVYLNIIIDTYDLVLTLSYIPQVGNSMANKKTATYFCTFFLPHF